jgi:hypothetical protein
MGQGWPNVVMVTFKYEAAAGVPNDEKRFFTTTGFPEMAPAYKLPCSQRFRPFPEELFRK